MSASSSISPSPSRGEASSERRTLKGLLDTIEVFRDAWGIPHVRARNAHDAFFGQGLVTAEDRLWQMDYDRRRAQGRVAEVVGPSARAQDVMMRRLQLQHELKDDWQALSPPTQAMLQAYAAGVNAHLERLAQREEHGAVSSSTGDAFPRNAASWPLEFERWGYRPQRWEALDSLAIFKVRHVMMGPWEAKLWRMRLLLTLGPQQTACLIPGYPTQHPVALPAGAHDQPAVWGSPHEEKQRQRLLAQLEHIAAALSALTHQQEALDQGSNNWVLSGERTAHGKPILGGDPHRFPDWPNLYYQNHIACDGQGSNNFDVIGFSFAGVPGFPHFGHTAQVAWSITHGMADNQDLFWERLRGQPPADKATGGTAPVDKATGGTAAADASPAGASSASARGEPSPPQYFDGQGWRPLGVDRQRLLIRGQKAEELTLYRTAEGPLLDDPWHPAVDAIAAPAAGAAKPGAAAARSTKDAALQQERWGLRFSYTAQCVPNRTLDSIHQMLFAADASQFEASQRLWVDPVNNLLFADRQGRFGYRLRGHLPLRPAANGWTPVPGAQEAFRWRGMLPPERLPRSIDPPQGYLFSANQPIFSPDHGWQPEAEAAAEEGAGEGVGEGVGEGEARRPYVGHDAALGFRATRLARALAHARGWTAAEASGILHREIVSEATLAFRAIWKRLQSDEASQGKLSATGRAALASLVRWDGVLAAEAPEPILFHGARHQLLRIILRRWLPAKLYRRAFSGLDRGANAMLSRLQGRLHDKIQANERHLLAEDQAWLPLLAEALETTCNEAQDGLRPRSLGQLRWGDVHRLQGRHPFSGLAPVDPRDGASRDNAPDDDPARDGRLPLDPPSVAMGGDADTLQAAGFVAALGFGIQSASVARYVFDLADWNACAWIVPGGASGHPQSPHYADQLPLYAQHRLLPMLYDWEQIAWRSSTPECYRG